MTTNTWDNTPSTPEADPFAEYEKTPSVTFPTVGTTYSGVVTEAPKLVQGRDFKNKKPATWEDGNPKMVVVIGLDVDGQRYSVWADKSNKDGSMFAALRDAQQAAGARIAVGGRLSIKFTGTEKSSVDGFQDRKLYAAKYEPNDPFGDNPAQGNSHTPAPSNDAAPPF